MRAANEFQRRLAAHRIHWNPHADVLPPLDVVVRLILVPGRLLPSARLLGEHVIVIQPHGAAAHQLCRGFGQARLADEPPVTLILLPGTEILDEAAGVRGIAGDLGARTQVRQVVIDAGAQQRDLSGIEPSAQTDCAVALKSPGQRGFDHERSLLWPATGQPRHGIAYAHGLA